MEEASFQHEWGEVSLARTTGGATIRMKPMFPTPSGFCWVVQNSVHGLAERPFGSSAL